MVLTVRESGAGDPLGEVGTSSRAERALCAGKHHCKSFYFFKALCVLTVDFSLETYRLLLFFFFLLSNTVYNDLKTLCPAQRRAGRDYSHRASVLEKKTLSTAPAELGP